jgi:DNA mismatch endonuclease, patch repair protein
MKRDRTTSGKARSGRRLNRSEIMSRVKSTGNRSTELRMKSLFKMNRIVGWRRGSRLFGRPDFVFSKQRLAIFVDGCFWHGHPTLCRMPKSNQKYWAAKIARNVQRDKQVVSILKAAGWKVLRIWEQDLMQNEREVLKRILVKLR